MCVRRAVRAGKYENLIVNAEAYGHVAHERGVADRLDHAGIAAPQLTAAEAEATATEVLQRMLLERDVVNQLDALARAGRARLHDGLVAFGLGLAGEVADAIFRGLAVDLRAAVGAALGGAARSAARTGVEAWLLLQRFASKARAAFSSRLLQRIARSRIAVSAIAEVVVETAIDLVDVLRDRMSFEDLLRRFGVHVTTAGGAAVGVAAGLALARGDPWWLSALAALFGGWLGAKGNHRRSRARTQRKEHMLTPDHVGQSRISTRRHWELALTGRPSGAGLGCAGMRPDFSGSGPGGRFAPALAAARRHAHVEAERRARDQDTLQLQIALDAGAPRHAAPAARPAGSSRRNAVPRPGVLSTATRPPCAFTM
ncbi:MAG: hypothetical protein IT376_02985 [Polyangiaceae bacterium]|nr:hypothetical protein [Polyangiaceae bacterium]